MALWKRNPAQDSKKTLDGIINSAFGVGASWAVLTAIWLSPLPLLFKLLLSCVFGANLAIGASVGVLGALGKLNDSIEGGERRVNLRAVTTSVGVFAAAGLVYGSIVSAWIWYLCSDLDANSNMKAAAERLLLPGVLIIGFPQLFGTTIRAYWYRKQMPTLELRW